MTLDLQDTIALNMTFNTKTNSLELEDLSNPDLEKGSYGLIVNISDGIGEPVQHRVTVLVEDYPLQEKLDSCETS